MNVKSPVEIEAGGGRKEITPSATTLGSEAPTDDAAYQIFVEEMAKHCRCQAPHQCPCDGVLAGGICDEAINEPYYTMGDG